MSGAKSLADPKCSGFIAKANWSDEERKEATFPKMSSMRAAREPVGGRAQESITANSKTVWRNHQLPAAVQSIWVDTVTAMESLQGLIARRPK
jgi:hypothetical protein